MGDEIDAVDNAINNGCHPGNGYPENVVKRRYGRLHATDESSDSYNQDQKSIIPGGMESLNTEIETNIKMLKFMRNTGPLV